MDVQFFFFFSSRLAKLECSVVVLDLWPTPLVMPAKLWIVSANYHSSFITMKTLVRRRDYIIHRCLLHLYIIYIQLYFLGFFFVKRPDGKTPQLRQQQQQKPYNWDQAIDWFMKNIIFLQVLCKDNPFTPSLKLQVPINIPPNIVCLFLFASASTYKSGTDTTLLYLQWWTKVWYVLYYYFYYYYLYFFYPKVIVFFCGYIKQHPHLLQTYND